MKLGVDYPSIQTMPVGVADALLEAWHDLTNPETGTKVKHYVKRK